MTERGLRIAVAALDYETNSFAPGAATVETMRAACWIDGEAVLTEGRGIDSIGGAMQVAQQEGVELVPTTGTGFICGPALEPGAWDVIKQRILDGLRPHVGSIDGVYLSLHGAMVCSDVPDSEGDLIRAVSELTGVPVSVSLDLHCFFTDQMAEGTPLIAGYRTLPHVDMFETGARAMRLLLHRLRGGSPTIGWTRIPMLTSSEGQDTNQLPIKPIIARIEEMLEDPRVLDGQLFMVQPWLDVPNVGWAAVIVTDDDPELARELSEEIAQLAWDARHDVVTVKSSIEDAVAKVSAADYRPDLGAFVLSDGADSVSAGCAGDGTELIAALAVAELPGPAMAVLTDAAAARACHEAGVGATLRLTVGGSLTTNLFRPIEVEGTVVTLKDTPYESFYPAQSVIPGKTAVLELANGLRLVLVEIAVPQLDLEPYRHLGLDPATAHVVVAKSAGGYRAYYEPIARECIDVAAVGPADSRIEQLPYTQVTRPLFPFDADLEWSAAGKGRSSR